MASIRNLIRSVRGGARSVDELHDYWRDPADEGNRPESYLGDGTEARSRFIVELASRHAGHDARVLEVGSTSVATSKPFAKPGFAT